MSIELVQTIFMLLFVGLCSLATKILVENHREEMSRRQHAP
jgi:hypothetical protein